MAMDVDNVLFELHIVMAVFRTYLVADIVHPRRFRANAFTTDAG
jgi:hypothetical protein